MARTYNSRRREESTERTRQAIIDAAIKLHNQGITTLSAVAEEAGVALPTVNKHFPTREDLFFACTSHVAANLEFISVEELYTIKDSGERLRRIVQEVYRLHELTFGQSWVGYKLEEESPVMMQAMRGYEGVAATMAETLPYENAFGDKDTVKGFVRAALNPLTYRAMKLKNGLSMDDAVKHMTIALAGVLNIAI